MSAPEAVDDAPRRDVVVATAASDDWAAAALIDLLELQGLHAVAVRDVRIPDVWPLVLEHAPVPVLVVLLPDDAVVADDLVREIEVVLGGATPPPIVVARVHPGRPTSEPYHGLLDLDASLVRDGHLVARHVVRTVAELRRARPEPTDVVILDGPLAALADAVTPIELLGAGRTWGIGRGGLLAVVAALARRPAAGFDIDTWHGLASRQTERAFTRMLLGALGGRTFDDVAGGHWDDDLAVIVSDMTAGRPAALPGDLQTWGLSPGSLPVADVVRATTGRLVRRGRLPLVRDQQGNPHLLQASTRPLLPHRPGPDRPLVLVEPATPPRTILDRVQRFALPVGLADGVPEPVLDAGSAS